MRQVASTQAVLGSRRVIVVAALLAAAVAATTAVAAKQWLTGEPAPASVVSDFNSYTPQLGFHPDAGKAVLAAEDGAFRLYATTNREGTYCVVIDEPWKHADAGDGGTCVAKRDARYPITAGLVGGTSGIWVVAGRVAAEGARTVVFTDPTGERIERPLGSGGFYVAAVQTAAGCPKEDWAPMFSARAGDGREIARSRILLEQSDRFGCGGGVAPHGPYPSTG